MEMELHECLRKPFFVLGSHQKGPLENGWEMGSGVEWFDTEPEAHSRAVDLKDNWAWVDVYQMLGERDENGLYPAGEHKRLERYREGKEVEPH